MNNSYTNYRKILLYVVIVISSFYFTACEIKEFVSPSWDVSINIPITNRSYTVKEIIEKDTSFLKFNGASSLLYYADTKNISTIKVNNDLTMQPTINSISQTIGSIKIKDPDVISDSIKVTKWVNVVPGQLQIFPAINNAGVTQPVNKNSAYKSVTFESGTLEMAVTNHNGPIAVTLNRVIIRNGYDDSPILVKTAPTVLNAEATEIIQFDLAGKSFVDSLSVEATFSTAGSSGQIVLIPSDAKTAFTLAIKNPIVSQAVAILPQQDPIVKNSTVKMDDSTSYTSVVFGGGSLSIALNSTLDFGITAQVQIAELKKSDGTSYSTQVSIPKKGTGNISIPDLNGYRLEAPSGNLTNQISYSVTANNVLTPGVTSTINKVDGINTNINFSKLILHSFNGKVKPTNLEIKETSIDINLKDLQNKFNFQLLNVKNSNITLKIYESANFQIAFSGTLTGTNGVQTRTLTIPKTTINNGGTEVVFPTADVEAFLSGFSNSLPEKLTVKGQSTVNPNFITGSITRLDSVWGDAKINIPMYVGIKDGTFTDSTTVDIASADTQRINDAKEIVLTSVITNGLPVSIVYSGDFYDANNKVILHFPPPRGNNDSTLTINAGLVDANGRVSTPKVDSISITMAGDDFSKVTKAKYIKSRVRVNTTGGNASPVQFYTSDAVKIRTFGSGKYKLDTKQ